MDLGLAGKTALVTGGSKGIGLETARALAREGVKVLICARREAALADAPPRLLKRFTAVAYNIPEGSAAAYYPEANPLLPLYLHDKQSGTPSGKAIPVRIFRNVDS